jgi:hypothetical protein
MPGIAPPPFGAPVMTPERKAAIASLIEAGKLLLDAVEQDPTIAKTVHPLAASVTKAAGQLQRPSTTPLEDGEDAEPELDRTPVGPPPEPGNPLLSFARSAMRG